MKCANSTERAHIADGSSPDRLFRSWLFHGVLASFQFPGLHPDTDIDAGTRAAGHCLQGWNLVLSARAPALAFTHLLRPPPAAPAQTHAEIIEIIKSLSSVKKVRLSVKSEYFGVDWAKEDAEQDRYEGVVTRWKTEGEILMIK
eukprot:scaffold1415_cov117-Isochrysis_galbana.AAC.5